MGTRREVGVEQVIFHDFCEPESLAEEKMTELRTPVSPLNTRKLLCSALLNNLNNGKSKLSPSTQLRLLLQII